MNSMWKFSPEEGKERGLLTILVLRLLDRKPGSGYGLLKEISQTTGGSWVPNKGSLYPLLKNLEHEGLIQVRESGKRSKVVYELTAAGEQLLGSLMDKERESGERAAFFKKMHLEIFGEENISLINLLMDIRFYIEALPEAERARAHEILRAAFSEIQQLHSGDE